MESNFPLPAGTVIFPLNVTFFVASLREEKEREMRCEKFSVARRMRALG